MWTLMLYYSKTYRMGEQTGFNEQLNDTTKRFTYFVPRDYAWNKMETRYPSAHKKLFMRDFSYHVNKHNNLIFY